MGQYGKAALEAVRLVVDENMTPKDAWETAICKYTDSESSQKKSCPQNAFLGLCAEGMIRGIPSVSYNAGPKNKEYAIEAVRILRKDPTLSANKTVLWKRVMNKCHKSISHDGQMDVVTSLWNNELIVV